MQIAMTLGASNLWLVWVAPLLFTFPFEEAESCRWPRRAISSPQNCSRISRMRCGATSARMHQRLVQLGDVSARRPVAKSWNSAPLGTPRASANYEKRRLRKLLKSNHLSSQKSYRGDKNDRNKLARAATSPASRNRSIKNRP